MKWDSSRNQDDEHEKYNSIENAKLNGPVYMALLSDPSTGLGHGCNAGWIGRIDSLGNLLDDPTDLNNWLYIEPQNNGVTKWADLNFPPNREFIIYAARNFNSFSSPDKPLPNTTIIFESDSTGNISVTHENPNLVANYNKNTNPTVHKRMRADMKWMEKNLKSTYSVSAKRSTGTPKATGLKGRSGKKLVRAGKKVVAGRERQLYRIQGSQSKFYRYRKTDGTMGKRYV